jgi:hypothetical protein
MFDDDDGGEIIPSTTKQMKQNQEIYTRKEEDLNALDRIHKKNQRSEGRNLDLMINHHSSMNTKKKELNLPQLQFDEDIIKGPEKYVSKELKIEDPIESIPILNLNVSKTNAGEEIESSFKKIENNNDNLLGKRNTEDFGNNEDLEDMFDSGEEGNEVIHKSSAFQENFSHTDNFLKMKKEELKKQREQQELHNQEIMAKEVDKINIKQKLEGEDEENEEDLKQEDEILNTDDDISGKFS